MRIGYLHFRLAGTDGVSLEAERWRKILTDMGHTVTFVAGELDRAGLLIPELHFSHPKIYKIHDMVISDNINYRKVEKEVFALAGEIEGELRKEFRRYGFDYLIVSNVFSLPIHFSLAIALERVINEFGLPTLSRNHDFWWERDRYLKSHCFEFFKRFFPSRSPFIKHLTINSLAQKEMKHRTGIDSQVIPDTFDFDCKENHLDEFSRHFRKDFNLSKEDIVFLQATRIVPRKNIEASIELLKRLNDARTVLVLAGYAGDEAGEYLTKLKDLAKKAGIRTRFIGSRIKSRRHIDEGIRYYTLWDAFVNCNFSTYPSTFEGFGNQFIEAVYFKKPVFVNRYEVYKSDIEPLGFQTVAINNGEVTQNSVDQIRFLLNHPELVKKMVNKNFELGKKYFSYQATEEKLRKVGLSKAGIKQIAPKQQFAYS